MQTRPALKFLVLVAFCFSFLCLASFVNSLQAQSRSGKNSARKLMDEMSESEDDGFEFNFDADDADASSDSDDSKTKKGPNRPNLQNLPNPQKNPKRPKSLKSRKSLLP